VRLPPQYHRTAGNKDDVDEQGKCFIAEYWSVAPHIYVLQDGSTSQRDKMYQSTDTGIIPLFLNTSELSGSTMSGLCQNMGHWDDDSDLCGSKMRSYSHSFLHSSPDLVPTFPTAASVTSLHHQNRTPVRIHHIFMLACTPRPSSRRLTSFVRNLLNASY